MVVLRCRESAEILDVDWKLAPACGKIEAWVMGSQMKHERVVIGCSANMHFGERTVIENYCCILIYAFMHGDHSLVRGMGRE